MCGHGTLQISAFCTNVCYLRPLVLLHMGLPKEGLHPSGQINSVYLNIFLNSLNYHFAESALSIWMLVSISRLPSSFSFGFYDSSNLIIRYIFLLEPLSIRMIFCSNEYIKFHLLFLHVITVFGEFRRYVYSSNT